MDSFWIKYSPYIIGIPTLALMWWIFIKQKNKKSLEYRIRANESLLSYHKEVEKNLVILFQDEKIDTLTLLILEFINSGNVSIVENDFRENLQIVFKEPIKILDVEIINKHPENLNLKFSQSENNVEFEHFLFNKKEKFSIKILLNKENPIYTVTARIEGAKIEKSTKREDFEKILSNLLIIFSLILAVILTIYDNALISKVFKGVGAIFFLLISLILVIQTVYLISKFLNKRLKND